MEQSLWRAVVRFSVLYGYGLSRISRDRVQGVRARTVRFKRPMRALCFPWKSCAVPLETEARGSFKAENPERDFT